MKAALNIVAAVFFAAIIYIVVYIFIHLINSNSVQLSAVDIVAGAAFSFFAGILVPQRD